MSISQTAVPNFLQRERITAEQLRSVSDPGVVFEHHGIDSDGVHFWCYTVCGWLEGKPLGDRRGGVTIGGDVIIVHAKSREEADALASLGLGDTIDALDDEEDAYIEAHAALARLNSVGAKQVIDNALKPDSDKSDAFVEDISKVRPLAGDDLILTGAH